MLGVADGRGDATAVTLAEGVCGTGDGAAVAVGAAASPDGAVGCSSSGITRTASTAIPATAEAAVPAIQTLGSFRLIGILPSSVSGVPDRPYYLRGARATDTRGATSGAARRVQA
ncbi:hypothetical protein GCM10009661_72630 [Catellatospora chokoriensis]|uniref:Uncharacterized protein n=1 Tax=Catellatospora chokoriensis TaxID=310353 RepID=A0A8J3KAC4_9ACTN|nr:hypothetical protein Cch02nite_58180 [Catellatospora chokoriensis]